MTPEEVAARLVAALVETGAVASVSGGAKWSRATVDVPTDQWTHAALAVRDDDQLACDYFDWLSAVDEMPEGFTVVTHVWSTTHRHGVLLRTRLPREAPSIPSIVDIYPGASWHERETAEMFGIAFAGHPDPKPLLLSNEFEGHPLRKDFVLAARVAKPWPGAKEPGEGHAPAAGGRRAPVRPPGVPDPNVWGPNAGAAGSADEAPARPARPARAPRTPGAARPPRTTPATGATTAPRTPPAEGAAPTANPEARDEED